MAMTQSSIEYPIADELLALSARCIALANSHADKNPLLYVVAYRAAIDLDHLGRLMNEQSKQSFSQWVVTTKTIRTAKKKRK